MIFVPQIKAGTPHFRFYDATIKILIHVASRRQPPAPHRWAAARNCQ